MSMNATPRPHVLLLVLCDNSVKYQCELLLLAKKKSGAIGCDSYTDLNWKMLWIGKERRKS